jgi:hypothetical protein
MGACFGASLDAETRLNNLLDICHVPIADPKLTDHDANYQTKPDKPPTRHAFIALLAFLLNELFKVMHLLRLCVFFEATHRR